ncbi:MAG: NAD(P)H-dependent oxidoreductase subunit E, partial [Rhodospirillaceae bacterium]|nr:NAD(P)H-dependent oxidoreductase subunit E [Rhodospirillaceae bacterium]
MSGPSPVALEQPDSFAFDGAHADAAEKAVARYPEGRQASAVLPLLDLAQRQHGGWVPRAAIEHIAGRLGMAKIRVMEVATFYTMINLAPVGTFHLQVCGTTPCMIRGAGEVFRAIRDEVGIGPGETSDDGQFTCTEVECLGACVNAPMVQVNDDFVEDLSYENFAAVLRALKNGDDLPVGSLAGRRSSEPEGGALTLLDVPPPVRFDPAAVYGAPSAVAAEQPAGA